MCSLTLVESSEANTSRVQWPTLVNLELKQEDQKFELRLGNLAQPCLKIKFIKDWGYSSVDDKAFT